MTQYAELGEAMRRFRMRTTWRRREHLAEAARVSVDYIARIEQGRARPTQGLLIALGAVLELSPAELEHVLALAGHRSSRRALPRDIPAGLERLVRTLEATPVCIYDPAWTILGWNAAWQALLGDPSALRGRQRNLVWRTFTGVPSRVRLDAAQRERFEGSLVADLKAVRADYPDDGELGGLVAALLTASDRFRTLWESPTVSRHVHERKTVAHPLGEVTLDCDVITAYDGAARAVVYSAAPDSATSRELHRILAAADAGHSDLRTWPD